MGQSTKIIGLDVHQATLSVAVPTVTAEKFDAALARALEIAPPAISKIRHCRMPAGASLLIRMHEVSGLTIWNLRYLMGDRRR